uniref:Uncharacterized protein n=1 Tax=Glossina pallidipes TaxID=7398 RepID=A0A1B0ADM4_GLOPL
MVRNTLMDLIPVEHLPQKSPKENVFLWKVDSSIQSVRKVGSQVTLMSLSEGFLDTQLYSTIQQNAEHAANVQANKCLRKENNAAVVSYVVSSSFYILHLAVKHDDQQNMQ